MNPMKCDVEPKASYSSLSGVFLCRLLLCSQPGGENKDRGGRERMQAGTRVCTAHVKMSGCARARVSFFFF